MRPEIEIVYGEQGRSGRAAPDQAQQGCFLSSLLKATADEEIILNMAEFAPFHPRGSGCDHFGKLVIPVHSRFHRARRVPARGDPVQTTKAHSRPIALQFASNDRFRGRRHIGISTLLLRLPIYILPFWFIALTLLSVGYAITHSVWYAIVAFLATAGYLGGSAAATALYVARSYKNGLVRPNAFIDRRAQFPSSDACHQKIVERDFDLK